MPDDYIKRSDALEHFGNYLLGYSIQKDDVIRGVKELPAADVEPVKHGRWIEQDSWGDTYYTCSICGGDFVTLDGESPEENEFYFCPMCGAKMDAEPPKEEDNDNH